MQFLSIKWGDNKQVEPLLFSSIVIDSLISEMAVPRQFVNSIGRIFLPDVPESGQNNEVGPVSPQTQEEVKERVEEISGSRS